MITPTIVAPSFRLMLVTSVHLVLLVWLWQSLPATVRAPLVLQMRMISAEPEASVSERLASFAASVRRMRSDT